MAHETQDERRLRQIRESGIESDPRFMAGPNAINAVVPERTEEEKILEKIALAKQAILQEQIKATEAELERTNQTNAIHDATNREAIPYERPPERHTGGVLGITPNDHRELRGAPKTTDPEFAIETPDKYSHAESAAANGVDVETGLRPGIRTTASLIDFNPQAQKIALETEIRNDLGPNFPAHEMVLARDPASGMASYLRKEGEGFRWTLVNPPGTDVGDILEFAGELPTFVLETAGAVGGALATGPTTGGVATAFGAATGSAIGGWISIPLRMELARMAGIPQEALEAIDIADEAKWQAMMSGGGELLGHGIVGAATSVRNFLGRPLDLNDIPALEAEIRKNAAIIRKAEEAGDTTFTPTVGQLTNDTDIQIAEATLRNRAVGRTAHELKAADVNNEKASAEALRNMATQEVRSPGASGFRSIEEVSQDAQELLVKKELAEPGTTADAAQSQVDEFDTRYAGASDREKLTMLQERSAEQYDEMRRLEKESWELHRDTIEWDDTARQAGIGLDNTGQTPIRDFMGQLQGDASQALMRTLAQANEATLKSAGFGPEDVARMMEGGDATGLASPLLDTRHLHTTLSHLKRTRAQMQDGINPNRMEVNDVTGLIDAIESQMRGGTFRRSATNRPVNPAKADQIRVAWDNANQQTELFHATFDGEAMRSMLRTRRIVDNGRSSYVFDMPPGMVHSRLFKSQDARFLRDAMEATGQDPQIRAGLADEFMKFTRQSVIRDGRVNQGAFQDLMANYQDHMELILGPENMAKITNLGSMGRVVDDMAKQSVKVTERLTHAYGRTIAEPTNPINVAEEILSNRLNSRQATNLMTDLRRMDGRLAAQVEEKVMERVFTIASKGDKQVIGFDALDNILINKRDTLMAVGGRRYVRDLDTLRDGLEVLSRDRFARATVAEPQTFTERVTRLLFGPLGRQQRMISAVARSGRNARAGVANALLADPTKLRQFARLKNLTPSDPRFWLGSQMIGEDFIDIVKELAPNEYQEFLDGNLRPPGESAMGRAL